MINKSGDAPSSEKFPLVIGGVLLIASLVMITAYAAVVIFQTQKKDRHGETDISYSWVGARIKSATLRVRRRAMTFMR